MSIARWLAAALALAAAPAAASERLVLQLSNVRQAQFAGYYTAQAQGFYAEAGLDVVIRPGPPHGDTLPPQPGADVWSAWLPAALAARADGLALVNFAQIFPHSGLELICRKTSGIHAPIDLKGRQIGVWQDGTERLVLGWIRRLGLTVPADVRIRPLPHAVGVAPLLGREVSCLTGLGYDDYWQVIAAGIPAADLQVFHFADAGLAPLQDGLYATEGALAQPGRQAVLARFLRASAQGWHYAVTHQSEAVRAVLADTPDAGPAETLRQTRMMSTIARLTESGLQRLGYLEPAAFQRSLDLLALPPDQTLPGQAARAWTHRIWDQAGR